MSTAAATNTAVAQHDACDDSVVNTSAENENSHQSSRHQDETMNSVLPSSSPPPSMSFPVTYIHSSLSNPTFTSYAKGWAWQQTLLSRRLEYRRQQQQQQQKEQQNETVIVKTNQDHDKHDFPDQDRLLLLEHEPVYTLGRGAKEENLTFLTNGKNNNNDNGSIDDERKRLSRTFRGKDSARLCIDRLDKRVLTRSVEELVEQLANVSSPVLAPNGAPIYRIERGGEVTCHLPGQLVAYPLLDLRREPYKQDLHWYLRMVEEVIVQILKEYDIEGTRDEENTGVWVGDDKIAAVGVSSSRWITTHGFALNVCPDLSFFDTSVIIPCGIEGKGVTSIVQVLKSRGEKSFPTVKEVADVTIQNFGKVFGVPTTNGGVIR